MSEVQYVVPVSGYYQVVAESSHYEPIYEWGSCRKPAMAFLETVET